MTNKPATSLIAGSLIVIFNQTTLADVLRQFPGPKISASYQQGVSASYSVCYAIRSVKPIEHVWFVSDGDMGGRTYLVTQIQATGRVLTADESSRCGNITKQVKFVFNNGLWIGSSVRQIRKVLGPPSAKRDNWLGYSYKGKMEHADHGESVMFDIGNLFQVHINKSRIAEIDASEVISN